MTASSQTSTRAAAGHTAESLLAQVAVGDREAFTALHEMFRPRLLGLVFRLVRDIDQAEEVTQETFLLIWQSAVTFDASKGSATPWVLRLAHARAVDRIRQSQAGRTRDEKFTARSHVRHVDSVVEEVLQNFEYSELRAALGQLTGMQRESVDLAYFGGLTALQISEILSVPLATVKTRIRDGIAKLRQELDQRDRGVGRHRRRGLPIDRPNHNLPSAADVSRSVRAGVVPAPRVATR